MIVCILIQLLSEEKYIVFLKLKKTDTKRAESSSGNVAKMLIFWLIVQRQVSTGVSPFLSHPSLSHVKGDGECITACIMKYYLCHQNL